MLTATILSWVLAAAPQAAPTDNAPTPPRADVTHGPDWARVLTYDATGEVSAEIVFWSVDAELRVDGVFPDGATMTATVIDGALEDVECVDCASAREQIGAVLDDMALNETLQASWLKCAGYAALTVGEIATGHPWLAVPTAVLAACECLEAYDEAQECF
jgi:hypothetical protein